MANENFKEIKTRIALRTGDYAYWTTGAGKDIGLLKGEVCICTVAAADNQATTAPTVLFKVCDATGKKFGELKWTSALAADVYDWAKAANVVFENEHILFKNVAGETIKDLDLSTFVTDGELTTKLANYYTKTEVDGLIDGVKDLVDGLDESTTTVAKGTGIDVTDTGTGNDHAYTVALDVAGAKTALGLGTAAYVTVDSLNTTAKGYADAVEAKIPTELGVMSVAKGNDAIEIGGTAKAPTVAVKLNGTQGNVTLTTDGGLKAAVDLSAYRLIADDEDTKYGLTYDSTNKVIKIVPNGGEAQISAADFIADGMLQKVEVDKTANTLTFTWNTDGGATVTTVNLTDIADIYTAKDNATEVQIAISNTNEISATLTKTVTDDIAKGVTAHGWGNHASANYAKAADLGDLAGKDKIVEGDIDGTIGVGKINGLGALATKDKVVEGDINGTIGVAKITNFATEVAAVKVANATNADNATNATNAGNADTLDNHDSTYFATAQSVTDLDNSLHAIAKTGSIYDVAEGSNVGTDKEGKEVHYIILDCNW